MEKVGIDDACTFLGRFDNGSLATFESTRYARGHKALYTFEINGENASIFWDLHDLHRLQYFDHRDEGMVPAGVRSTSRDSDHPYMGKWWVPGLQIGYEHSFVHQVADFLEGLPRQAGAARLPRRLPDATGARRDSGIRQGPQVGEGGRGVRICRLFIPRPNHRSLAPQARVDGL